MKNIFLWVILALTLVFWPISFIASYSESWVVYLFATAILFVGWVLYLKKVRYHQFLYLLLPIVHPAYLVFPIVIFLLSIQELKKPLVIAIFAVLLIFVSQFSYNSFLSDSIFTKDSLAWDTLNKKISLIPNRNLARVYENKTTIPQEKFIANVFIAFDLNNYFFAMHPRELSGASQNLNKYPFLAMIPFLIGLFSLPKDKHRRWILITLIASIVSISFLNNQGMYSALLFIPISLIIFSGLKKLSYSEKYFWFFSIVFIPYTLIELVRIIIIK